jgi:protoporphyrinogen IX oxidase
VTWYEFLLFVHISMAVIWVGGATIIQLFALRALRAPDPTRMADFASDASYISTRVFIPASLLALVSGVWMVLDSDFIGFGDDWIVIGLILYAVTFLAGALFFGPEAGRIKQQIDAEGPTSAAVQARIQRVLALSRADLMLLFTLIYDMSVKPEWGDAWLWIALAGFAALAGVLVRNGLKTRVAGGAAVPAG